MKLDCIWLWFFILITLIGCERNGVDRDSGGENGSTQCPSSTNKGAGKMPVYAVTEEWSFERCNKCGSIRAVNNLKEQKIIYRSDGFAGCDHEWKGEVKDSVLVPNGVVVLVRKGDTYGAFILRRQTLPIIHSEKNVQMESVEYQWCYRSDGNSILDPDCESTKSGRGSGRKIEFGPFGIKWSIANKGLGYLYYGNIPYGLLRDGNVLLFEPKSICVTSEKEMKGIDASDKKWIYRAVPHHLGEHK